MQNQRWRRRLCGRLVRARSLQLMIAPIRARPLSNWSFHSLTSITEDVVVPYLSLSSPFYRANVRLGGESRRVATSPRIVAKNWSRGQLHAVDYGAESSPDKLPDRILRRTEGRGRPCHGICRVCRGRPRPPPRAEVSRRFRLVDADSEISGTLFHRPKQTCWMAIRELNVHRGWFTAR